MAIAAVISSAVLLSLRTLADKLHYETTLHNLRLETRRMRLDYIRRTEGPAAAAKRSVQTSSATTTTTATTTAAAPATTASPIKAAA